MAITLDGTLGITTPTYGGATSAEYSVPVTGFKNRIINGAMVIDQRNAGASVTIPATSVVYTLDRWYGYGSQASKFSIQQNAGSVTPPAGFTNYIGCASLSAYSIGSGDEFDLGTRIEGFNASDLAWGTANASTVTLSFKVYSSLTGTFGGSLRNASFNRAYPFSFTVTTANTWTTISITIAGDTSGTWGTGNGIGIIINFSLGTGSTLSGTAGSWQAGAFTSATGATSVVGTSGATFYITGVQLEKGSTATSFDYRPYGTELQLCQRYYQLVSSFTGSGNSTTQIAAVAPFQTPMRATPTSGAQGVLNVSDGTGDFVQSAAAANLLTADANSIILLLPNFTSITANRIYLGYRLSNTNKITLSAEL